MKKVLFALIIAVALIAVSCSDYNVTNDLCSVQFGRLEAKAGTSGVSGVVADPNNLYWTYTAEKIDGGSLTGDTRVNNNHVQKNIVAEGEDPKGYTATLIDFAPGKWKFTIYGYLTKAARDSKDGDKLIYMGTCTSAHLEVGKVATVAFNVEIQDGSNGIVVLQLPDQIGGAEYKATVEAALDNTYISNISAADGMEHTSSTITQENLGTDDNKDLVNQITSAQDVKQGLWEITIHFASETNVDLGADVKFNALVLNGATTTIRVKYDEETTSWKVDTITVPSSNNGIGGEGTPIDWTAAYTAKQDNAVSSYEDGQQTFETNETNKTN